MNRNLVLMKVLKKKRTGKKSVMLWFIIISRTGKLNTCTKVYKTRDGFFFLHYLSSLGREVIHLRSGNKKAAVFPLPVSATPMMSRFCRPIGIACLWMGVGSCKSIELSFSKWSSCDILRNSTCIFVLNFKSWFL